MERVEGVESLVTNCDARRESSRSTHSVGCVDVRIELLLYMLWYGTNNSFVIVSP